MVHCSSNDSNYYFQSAEMSSDSKVQSILDCESGANSDQGSSLSHTLSASDTTAACKFRPTSSYTKLSMHGFTVLVSDQACPETLALAAEKLPPHEKNLLLQRRVMCEKALAMLNEKLEEVVTLWAPEHLKVSYSL